MRVENHMKAIPAACAAGLAVMAAMAAVALSGCDVTPGEPIPFTGPVLPAPTRRAPTTASLPCPAPIARPGVPVPVLPDQPATGGVLDLSIRLATGPTAARTFTDEAGRVVRRIYYTSTRSRRGGEVPTTAPDDLGEFATEVYRHDGAGRLVMVAYYDWRRRLVRTSEYAYWPGGQKKLNQLCHWLAGLRTVYAEGRFTEDGRQTFLNWDAESGELNHIDGFLPPDVDLVGGWGRPEGGLQCGLWARGYTASLIIRNVSPATVPVARADDVNRLRPELIAADGRRMPYDQRELRRRRGGTTGGPRSLAPGHATTEHCSLGEWYGRIPLGRYRLTVRRLSAEGRYDLISNPVLLEIRPPTAVVTAAGDHLHLELCGRRYHVFPDRLDEGPWIGSVRETVEGVAVTRSAGQVTFAGAGAAWTAALADGQVVLTRTSPSEPPAVLRGKRFVLELYEGQVTMPAPSSPPKPGASR